MDKRAHAQTPSRLADTHEASWSQGSGGKDAPFGRKAHGHGCRSIPANNGRGHPFAGRARACVLIDSGISPEGITLPEEGCRLRALRHRHRRAEPYSMALMGDSTRAGERPDPPWSVGLCRAKAPFIDAFDTGSSSPWGPRCGTRPSLRRSTWSTIRSQSARMRPRPRLRPPNGRTRRSRRSPSPAARPSSRIYSPGRTPDGQLTVVESHPRAALARGRTFDETGQGRGHSVCRRASRSAGF
jgi:hypothetical protein